MNKSTLWAVIAVLLVIILCMVTCNDCITGTTSIDTVIDTSYIHDTVKLKGKTKIKPVPIPYYVHDTIIDSTGDTVVIQLKKFITNDTFTYNTDSVKVTVYTKIYSNGPLDSISNELRAIIRSKVIEKEITKETVRKHAFFAGPSIGLSKVSYISLDGLYERNGKIIYKLGAGLNTNFQPILKAGIYYQISK
jgi:hypothetical protein